MNPASSMMANNPVAMLGSVIIFIGVIMMIGGAALAVILRKKGRE